MSPCTRNYARAGSAAVVLGLVLAMSLASPRHGMAQATIGATIERPFVIAVVPVVSRGAVGGVSVDTAGVLARADLEAEGKLQQARRGARREVAGPLFRASPSRKISLRRLEAVIGEHVKSAKPLPDEVLYLAGLQHVRHVFVYPQQHDIVLAGFAEGWQVDAAGNLVGRSTGHPVLYLADLIVALRTAEAAARAPISCSIDPSEEGLRQLRRLLRRRDLPAGRGAVGAMEQALGPQQITISGVPPQSRFARVMVAADYRMKRLAMDLEPSPLAELPSYMKLLQESRGRLSQSMMPRWWLAPRYDPVLKDHEGLAWQLRSRGVEALTEERFVNRGGQLASSSRSNRLAQQWADRFTDNFATLARRVPAFAELQNCIDLAVAAALIARENLSARAGYEMSLLIDPEAIAVGRYPVPRTVGSQASAVRRGRDWIVSVSGGVEISAWQVLEKVEPSESLADARKLAQPKEPQRWWWD